MITRLMGLCFVVNLVTTLPQGGNLDDLIKDVFGEGNIPVNTPEPLPPPGPKQTDNDVPRDNRGTLENDGDCTCVPYYLCKNGTILTDGSGLLDLRDRGCLNTIDTCCKEPLDEDHPQKPPPTKRNGCGQRHPNGVGLRITGALDHEAQFGEFPWMVALLKKTKLDGGEELLVYACGGALIHEKVVLTAAHCVIPNGDNEELLARAGEWDTQTNNEVYPHKNEKVAQVIIHPGFRKDNLHNDFALLILENAFPLGENIDTVCLPNIDFVPLSRECYATGWGKDKFDDQRSLAKKYWRPKRRLSILRNITRGIHTFLEDIHSYAHQVGSVWPSLHRHRDQRRPWSRNPGVNEQGKEGVYQVILKKIDLPIVTKDQCVDLLRQTRLGRFFKLHDSFVCAGGVLGKDTCKGDGGSPLVCPVDGKPDTYEVTGLVSWGIGCGNVTPGVYARVAYARQWIDSELSSHGIRIE